MASWERIFDLARRNDARARQAISDRNVSDILLEAAKARRDMLNSIVAKPVVRETPYDGAVQAIDSAIPGILPGAALLGVPVTPRVVAPDPANPVASTPAAQTPPSPTAPVVAQPVTVPKIKLGHEGGAGAGSSASYQGIDTDNGSRMLAAADRYSANAAGVGDLSLASSTANELLRRRTTAETRPEQAYIDAITSGINNANHEGLYIGDYGRLDTAIKGANDAIRNREDNATSASNTEARVQATIASGIQRSINGARALAGRVAGILANRRNLRDRLGAADDDRKVKILGIMTRHLDNMQERLASQMNVMLNPMLQIYGKANVTTTDIGEAMNNLNQVRQNLAVTEKNIAAFVNDMLSEGDSKIAATMFSGIAQAFEGMGYPMTTSDIEDVRKTLEKIRGNNYTPTPVWVDRNGNGNGNGGKDDHPHPAAPGRMDPAAAAKLIDEAMGGKRGN